jgi:hypothetical protein
MQLSASPDLTPTRRMLATALAVGVAAAVTLAIVNHDILTAIGDDDDAMRLVLVRDLLAGRGWYDQSLHRVLPPGEYMHWSRLLDGALAGLMWGLSRVMPVASAERATRFFWPLALVFPAIICALSTARSLGGRAVVMIAAILAAMDPLLYLQFHPGRVDHHNVQIVMTLTALAAATARRPSAGLAVVAAAAAALGLAIGIEALAFHAVIGASFGLRLAADRRFAPIALAYGLALALASAGVFLLQTPPVHWPVAYCDAIGLNLVAGLVASGLGLAIVAGLAPKAGAAVRLGLLALTAAAGAGLYLGLDPACIRGPMASVDPRLMSFWFGGIQELMTLPQLYAIDRIQAIHFIVASLMAIGACAALLVRARRPSPEVLLVTACVLVAALAGYRAFRMHSYVYWFGVPAIAAALEMAAARLFKGVMVPTVSATVLISPPLVATLIASTAQAAAHLPAQTKPKKAWNCGEARAFTQLRGLPPGLALSETDLGPFILAFTPHSIMAAPYQRMSVGILAAHDALAAPPAAAEAKVRGLGAAYVVDCLGYTYKVEPDGLIAALRASPAPPAWLERLSPPGATLQIYRVRPR